MKIIYSILLFTLLSCKKDEVIKQPSTCNCYERHEQRDFEQGSLVLTWVFKYNTTTQPDLCAKQTNEWVYSGNANQFRYKVICQ
jgi:hypothetical protein